MAVKHTNSNGTGQGSLAADGEAYSGNISGSSVNDSFTINNNSTVTGAVFPDTGNDSVLLDSGGRVGLFISSGAYAEQSVTYEIYNNSEDGLTPRQTVVGYYLSGGYGSDTITIDGTGYGGSDEYAISVGESTTGNTAIYGGAGNDQISVANGVLLSGGIDVGDGSDTISVGPDVRIEGSITSANNDGNNDVITVDADATVTDSIRLTGGDDKITLAGHIGDGSPSDAIMTGEGEDELIITSTAVVNVSQINIGTTEGGSLTIEQGAHTTLYPGTANPGAAILGTHGDDTVFLGGTYNSSHDIDVDGFGVSDDLFTLGSDFSATNTGANSVFKINGGGNSIALDYDTFNIGSISSRITSHVVDPSDAEHGTITLDDGSVIEYFEMENVIMCFAGGTKIMTDDGERLVEDLRASDLVLTKEHGLQPIRWIGSRKLTAAELETAQNLRPVRIRAGALGKNLPESNLTVSPQHRILVRSKIAQRMFSADEVLVAAKHLLECDGIEIVEDGPVSV